MVFFPTAVLQASSTAANSNECFPCPHQQCVSAFSGIVSVLASISRASGFAEREDQVNLLCPLLTAFQV